MTESSAIDATMPLTRDRRDAERLEFNAALWPAAAMGRDRQPAQVRDLSATGVSLFCDASFDVGWQDVIELPAEGGTFARFEGRIVRAVTQPGGGWLLGAAFTRPLTPNQLRQLLGE